MTYTATGPMFDGRADQAAKEATNKIAEQVAIEGYELITTDLARVIRTHPTGRYIPSVRNIRVSDSQYEIGTGIIYGPWIEGTGSRNETTRFKGYATFRRQAQALDGKTVEIAERTLPPYIERMN